MCHLAAVLQRGLKKYEAGEIQLNTLYKFQELSEENGRIIGQWQKVGDLIHTEKLEASGKI